MTESSILNRIKFHKKGTQKAFILKAKNLLKLNGQELSSKLEISSRTLTDWMGEKINMSMVSAQKISKLAHIPIPKNYSIIDWRVHLQNAGKIGGRKKFIMYGNIGGDEAYRKEKWKQWWLEIGQYKKKAKGFQTLKKIKTPQKSKLLAEFIGILLGDGNISKYNIGITLSSEEKKYAQYVCIVIQKLFGTEPKIFRHKSLKAVSIIVNRKLLVDFCQKVGFEMGNKVKHQVDIPIWIKENKEFSRECIRGLFDTDGCFFFHNYIVKGKRYSYFKIAFTSASRPLVLSVAETLINFGFNVRISKNHKDVRIEDKKYVEKYIREMGSHNNKHIEKIKKWKVALNGKAAVC